MDRKNFQKIPVSLASLKKGDTGTIASIKTGKQKRKGWGFKQRLMDMGLTPGTKITVIKSAPFNGPFEIMVRKTRLVIGRGMAMKIFVEPEPSA
jgi:Fe2+ transport system protein FeoA